MLVAGIAHAACDPVGTRWYLDVDSMLKEHIDVQLTQPDFNVETSTSVHWVFVLHKPLLQCTQGSQMLSTCVSALQEWLR